MDLKAHEEELRDEYGIKEPEELFQDSWFFGNLLQRSCNKQQSETIRRFSDPCTPSSSSNCSQELIMTGKSYEETYESIKKLSMVRDRDDDESSRPVLVKAPSMPSSMEGKDKTLLARGSGLRRSKLPSKKKSSSNLVRAPSLPVNLGDECFEDEEIEFSLGRLIRQASMNCSDGYLPPRTHDTKGTTPGSSLSRQRSRMKPEVEIIKGDVLEDTPPQHQQLEPRSRLTPPLKPDESQKLKTEEKSIRRSHYYYSEAWKEHNSSAPQVPLWDGKRSSNDTKEQIKFWARAVASNVRQEC